MPQSISANDLNIHVEKYFIKRSENTALIHKYEKLEDLTVIVG